jgi:hypothetical protein
VSAPRTRWPRAILVLALGAGAGARASVDEWFNQSDKWFNHSRAPLPPYLDQPSGREAPRQLELNGAKLKVAVGSTARAPAEVRRWYSQAWQNLLALGDDEAGSLATLDFGEPLTVDLLRRRLGRFLETGQLGELGQVRYVQYQRAPGGGTQYLSLWTDDGLDLARLLPDRGDVDGGDLDGVPRFPGAVRVLAAGERGQAERLRQYRGAGSVMAVSRFYRDRLRAGGWVEDPRFADFAAARAQSGLHFRRGARELFLHLARVDGETAVSAIEMGR